MAIDVQAWLRNRFHDHPRCNEFVGLYDRFNNLNLKDPHFNSEITNGNDSTFWQRFSEMYVADHFTKLGYEFSSADKGPDFYFSVNNRRYWIEVICPEPCATVATYLEHARIPFCAQEVPHEAILLRYTSALKAKRDIFGRYTSEGIIGDNDICVIVISSVLLGPPLDSLYGISQYPQIIEATAGLGPLEITIDRSTMSSSRAESSFRGHVVNRNSSSVNTGTFLDNEFGAISAALAFYPDFDSDGFWAMMHNANASNPVPRNAFGCSQEYEATLTEQQIQIRRVNGTGP